MYYAINSTGAAMLNGAYNPDGDSAVGLHDDIIRCRRLQACSSSGGVGYSS